MDWSSETEVKLYLKFLKERAERISLSDVEGLESLMSDFRGFFEKCSCDCGQAGWKVYFHMSQAEALADELQNKAPLDYRLFIERIGLLKISTGWGFPDVHRFCLEQPTRADHVRAYGFCESPHENLDCFNSGGPFETNESLDVKFNERSGVLLSQDFLAIGTDSELTWYGYSMTESLWELCSLNGYQSSPERGGAEFLVFVADVVDSVISG